MTKRAPKPPAKPKRAAKGGASATSARQDKIAQEKKAAFLDQLRDGVSVHKAAVAAGVSRATVYRWRDEDEDFLRDWADAYECGTDTLEDEARRRAFEGIDKPVFYKGSRVGYIREYSDTLLMQQLNARRPEKYRTNHKVEHSGAVKLSFDRDDANL